MRLLPALLAVLAVAASAAAQLPTTPTPCGPGQLNVIPASANVAPGGTTHLTGAVANTNQQQRNADVLVAATAPAGWIVTLEPESFPVNAGQTSSFDIRVDVPANATTEGTIELTATFACSALPVDRWASSPVTATVTPRDVAAGPGDRLLDLGETYGIWVLGGLAVVAIGGAAVAGVTRSRAGLLADSPEPLKPVRPGRGTSFPITVENRDRQPDTIRFEVGDVPVGWAAFTALPEVTLAPGERRTMWLMVRSPEDAREGSSASIPLTVRSDSKPDRSRSLQVRAEVKDSAEPATSAGESLASR